MKKYLLVAILFLAILLRFIGIRYSFPPYHSDEGMSYSQGITMIKHNEFDAHGYQLRYAYPYGVPLINAALFKFVFIPLGWIGFYFRNVTNIVDGFMNLPLDPVTSVGVFQNEILGERDVNVLVWGRIISATMGVGVVYFVYKITRKFFTVRAALVASFLVAINFRQVLNSHINLPDIYNAFFLLVSVFMTLRLFRKPTRFNYLLAGIFAGLSVSIKFHPYALIGLFSLNLIEKKIFDRKVFLAFFGALLAIVLVNSIHVVNFDKMLEQLSHVALKYQAGKNQFDFFGYSYLFHYGIGKLTSIAVVIGVIVSLIKFPRKTIVLLSIVLAFLYVVTFYTGGSFYTRNFVTITPILLIFAGIAIDKLSLCFGRIGVFVLAVFLFVALFENGPNSFTLIREYSSGWNYKQVETWVNENVSSDSIVAAHSSVPIRVLGVKRIAYNFDNEDFSLEEFMVHDADYVIPNFDWVSTGFYWWMVRPTKESLMFWEKPTAMLEQTFAAMAVREISDFAIYSVINSWQAPDSNFIVARVPVYNVEEKSLVVRYTFDDGEEGWEPRNSSSNLRREEGSLIIGRGGEVPYTSSWESPLLEVSAWTGFVVKSKIKAVDNERMSKIGFLTANFYSDASDVTDFQKRISSRLSRRTIISDEWEEIEFIGEVPSNAKVMTLKFQSYTSRDSAVYLDEVELYNASVTSDVPVGTFKPIKVDQNILFPNSHGNL